MAWSVFAFPAEGGGLHETTGREPDQGGPDDRGGDPDAIAGDPKRSGRRRKPSNPWRLCRPIEGRFRRSDRLARERALDPQPRFADVAQTPLRIALEAAAEQLAQARRHLRGQPAEVDFFSHHRRERVDDALAGEQPLAGEHL